jgi:type II secretory pathway pseudopilin PulG
MRKPWNPLRLAGITLVELLVVVAIMGVLISLLLPAVQKAREAASRTQCASHLKQVGLAVHAYHNTHRQLPPTCIRQDWATWAVLILPYVEQRSLYQLWDTRLRYYDQPNRNTASDPTPHNVPIYFCPSRRGPDIGFSAATGNTVMTADIPTYVDAYGGNDAVSHRPGGLADYAACFGNSDKLDGNGALSIGIASAAVRPDGTPVDDGELSRMYKQPPGTRITAWKSQTSLTSITDGASNTLLIGEKYILPASRWGKSEDRSVYNGGWAKAYRRMAGVGPGGTPHVPLVADPNDTWAGQTPLMSEASQRFGSHHPGVCQFVFCDGTVRSVRSNVDETTLSRLAERSDGKAVPDDY